jgi:hypothetical protein
MIAFISMPSRSYFANVASTRLSQSTEERGLQCDLSAAKLVGWTTTRRESSKQVDLVIL